jgi:Beta-lactamase enzyme family/ORF 12 gene product N-terminal
MNWFWLHSCRHGLVTSAGGLPHHGAGQPARRRAARRILYALAGMVVAGAAAGCTGSPGSTGQGRAATGASPLPVFVSRTVPDAAVGTQLTWFLGAVAEVPWSRQVIQAHFDSGFLAQVSPDQINSLLEEVSVRLGASLTGVLWQDPARDPVTLRAVADIGGLQSAVTISVDSAGLISGLLLMPYQPPPASWAQADQDLAALAPDASLLVARVSPDGNCTPVHQVAASAARPLGSMFKLFVLGALAHQIAAGRVSWTQELTVTDAVKSPGSGSLQDDPDGTRISVQQTAAMMVSTSDNTAADMLIGLVGRSAVQAQDRQWSDHAALNVPFLTARESLLLKIINYPALANRYLSLAPGQRAAFLASSVDPLPFNQAQLQNLSQAWTGPRDIDTIEYFASPDDICRAFAGLQQLAAQPALAPLGSILSASNGDIELDPAQWPTVWFKGGSEPGVLTLGYLATNSRGQTFVVVGMLADPAAAPPPQATAGLLAIAQGAFGLVR